MAKIEKTAFILIGGGWRAEFYMRLAQKMPDRFEIIAIVTINPEQQAYYAKAPWHFTCVASLTESLKFGTPDFVVICVPHSVVAEVSINALKLGLPVLSETPAGSTLADLQYLAEHMPNSAKYQVAEQYYLRPDMAARLSCIAQGKIGVPQLALISLTNNYHAISLMRKFLNVSGHDTTIKAQRFEITGQPGFERGGPVETETFRQYQQTLATFEFGQGMTGIYNFEDDQHRSFIRSQHIQIKGNYGELNDKELRYLKDFQTPMISQFRRFNKGEDENMEGLGLKGIVLEGEWLYQNPYPKAVLSDDEIALATCLDKMADYCKGGQSFYSFEQAAQDFYLTLLIESAIATHQTVRTEEQPWTAALLKAYEK
ncbi:MAG: Gfo/Idh/MocA family protein [Pseudolactococcus laudensis]